MACRRPPVFRKRKFAVVIVTFLRWYSALDKGKVAQRLGFGRSQHTAVRKFDAWLTSSNVHEISASRSCAALISYGSAFYTALTLQQRSIQP
jgi:hypothetical protein